MTLRKNHHRKQQKERLGLTKTQPFVFSQPKRVMRAPPTDTEDLRWQKAVGATNTSSSSTSKHAFSRPNLIESENPNQMPPKTTAKTLQYQQWNAQKIRERQQREEQHRLELESYANPPEEIKERVQNTLSKEKQDQGTVFADQLFFAVFRCFRRMMKPSATSSPESTA